MSSTFTSAVTIANVGVEAIDSVMGIMSEAFDPEFGEAWNRAQCLGILGLPNVWLMLATYKNKSSGFALARRILDETELLLIGVKPEYRGHGIGKQLLEFTINEARQHGSSFIHLEVREGNAALLMYKKAGFGIVGRRLSYYRGLSQQSFDALTLKRQL